MSECPIHRTELTLGRCWMCRGVPPGAASRSEQSAVVCQCCGRGPDECPLVAGASATCAGGDCACFPDPAAEAAQSPQEGAAREALEAIRRLTRDKTFPFPWRVLDEILDRALAEPGRSVSDRPPASESPGPLVALLREARVAVAYCASGAIAALCSRNGCEDLLARIDAALRESSAERGGEDR